MIFGFLIVIWMVIVFMGLKFVMFLKYYGYFCMKIIMFFVYRMFFFSMFYILLFVSVMDEDCVI